MNPPMKRHAILFWRYPIPLRPEFIALSKVAKHILKCLCSLRHRLAKCRPSILDLLDNRQSLFHSHWSSPLKYCFGIWKSLLAYWYNSS